MKNRATMLREREKTNLSDFSFFLAVMKDKRAYECALSIILDEPGLKLLRTKVEEVVLNVAGRRAIRLDAWAEDADGRNFNMEMQNDTVRDDVRKRSRFYQGLMDSPILKAGKGTKYKNLPPTVIVFITQEDIFGRDLACYTFTEQCEEIAGLGLGDQTKKIFLNMSSRNGREELVSLLQYMKDTRIEGPGMKAEDGRIRRLHEIVEEVRESEEWEDANMSIYKTALEKGLADGMERGKAEGKAEAIMDVLSDLGKIPRELEEKIQAEKNIPTLRRWIKLAARAETIYEFESGIRDNADILCVKEE